jgi:hypothetical protein
LTYLLGPLSLWVTPQGRRGRKWLSIAILAAVFGLIVTINWGRVRAQMAAGESSFGWFVVVAIVIGLALTAWIRSVIVTGRALAAPEMERLPYWLRRPWATGIAGLLLPGLGHLVAGRVRRGAVALSLLGPTAMAALVLGHADRLWRGYRMVEGPPAAGLALERLFLFAAAVLVLGGLAWIALALDAARLQGVVPAVSRRHRGDWFAAALVVTLILSAAVFRPAGVAQRMDHYAVALQDEGLRIIPLWLERSAVGLDPAQPTYTLRCAELYAALGQTGRAEQLRASLDGRWVTYATMLRAEHWAEGSAAESAESTIGRSPSAAPTTAPPTTAPPLQGVPRLDTSARAIDDSAAASRRPDSSQAGIEPAHPDSLQGLGVTTSRP